MKNWMKMTVKILLIVMIPKFFLTWGVIINAVRGIKFQIVPHDPPLQLCTKEFG